MEVQPIRPSGASQDAQGNKKTETAERFAARDEPRRGTEPAESDANTRLSNEPDAVELSEEGRELSRRFEEGDQ